MPENDVKGIVHAGCAPSEYGPRAQFYRRQGDQNLAQASSMSLPIVTRLSNALPVAVTVAVQSSERKGVGPDAAHLFVEILAKVGYVENAPAIVQVGINQVVPEAFEHR